jgi:hypothetical protein
VLKFHFKFPCLDGLIQLLIQIFRQNARKGFSGTIDFKIFQGHVPDPHAHLASMTLAHIQITRRKGGAKFPAGLFWRTWASTPRGRTWRCFNLFRGTNRINLWQYNIYRERMFLIGYCYWLRLKMRYSPYVNKGFVYISVSKILNFIRQLFIFSWF